ncbi:MAG TPA: S41 family peptidase [Myxococcales bacterium]|jgi:carboxyl-terminal processing protease|nr:S41 family peptidase [Myxococcales bacterium]
MHAATLSLTLLLLAAAPEPKSAAIPATLVDEIASLVEQQFFSPPLMKKAGWKAAVARARTAIAQATTPAARTEVLREMLAVLATSHTEFYPRDDPSYWALLSIYDRTLSKSCKSGPPFPVVHHDIGVFWKETSEGWFVGGVLAGGPAETAGLKLGDRIASEGFSPVHAFAGTAGRAVKLEVQRTRGGPLTSVQVTPVAIKPMEEFQKATEGSWRIIERGGKHIAYVRVWAWSSRDIQESLIEAIGKSNQAKADAFILDLRDGWGGADPSYLGIFSQDVPRLESIGRDGEKSSWDVQIRKPAVLLINGGSRSGKEPIAYGAKKHHLAKLVGERTAGAVTFGGPTCLSDGSLLYVARLDALVDGERLEGRGVSPDVEVPFDFRYAAGRDPQLERALDLLSEGK